MSEKSPEQEKQQTSPEIVVASVLSSDRVVINKGREYGVRVGNRFLIYELDDGEITDPITKESLGRLEIPKGTGRIVSVQPRMAVLESDKEPSTNRGLSVSAITDLMQPSAMAPFRSPQKGDKVKRIG